MIYSDNGPVRRIYRPLRRRPAGWRPDPDLVVVNNVVAEFPRYRVDEVLAEVCRRGSAVTREFVSAVIETSAIVGAARGGTP